MTITEEKLDQLKAEYLLYFIHETFKTKSEAAKPEAFFKTINGYIFLRKQDYLIRRRSEGPPKRTPLVSPISHPVVP